MCVRCTRRLRGRLNVTLFDPSGRHLELQARIVWTKRYGFRKHMAGLEFLNVSSNAAMELAKIGTH